MNEIGKCDALIVGAGPAGMTAAIYLGRALLSTVVLERMSVGGQVILTDKIENYPGFPDGVGGMELSELMRAQAEKFNADFRIGEVTGLRPDGADILVDTADGYFRAGSVLLASGSAPRRIGIPGESRLTGRGVSYCATCDGAFFAKRHVAVVGGGNSALDEALFLTRFASKITVIHRRDSLRAEKILQERAFAEPKIEFIWNAVPVEVLGEDGVSGLRLRDVKTGAVYDRPFEGVFVFVGYQPNTEFLKGVVELNEWGYIKVDKNMSTSLKGVFAAGDATDINFQQIITSCGDAGKAALRMSRYLEELHAASKGR